MSRSLKKGPYIGPSLAKKVSKMNEEGSRDPIKTWGRASTIPPDFVGHTFLVHDGRRRQPKTCCHSYRAVPHTIYSASCGLSLVCLCCCC